MSATLRARRIAMDERRPGCSPRWFDSRTRSTRRGCAPAGHGARLADQRLRVLHRHALDRGAGRRRERGPALLARRLAREPALQRPRARGARAVRGDHPGRGLARARRGLGPAVAEFGPRELAHLVFAITAINAWNRLVISARTEPRSCSRPMCIRRRSVQVVAVAAACARSIRASSMRRGDSKLAKDVVQVEKSMVRG